MEMIFLTGSRLARRDVEYIKNRTNGCCNEDREKRMEETKHHKIRGRGLFWGDVGIPRSFETAAE